MQKRAPTLGNMFVIILFVFSCFGLLLFLWESFGGPLPLKPKGYRFTVAFPHALALAEQSDVRITGVDVGHVVALKTRQASGRTAAERSKSASRYAPIRANMHAILRQKTLLGETYVQLIPRGRAQRTVPARRRDSSPTPGRTVGHARRHPLGVRSEDARATSRSGSRRSPKASTDAANRSTPASRRSNPFVEHANTLVGCSTTQEGAVRALVTTRASCSTRSPGATTSSKG